MLPPFERIAEAWKRFRQVTVVRGNDRLVPPIPSVDARILVGFGGEKWALDDWRVRCALVPHRGMTVVLASRGWLCMPLVGTIASVPLRQGRVTTWTTELLVLRGA